MTLGDFASVVQLGVGLHLGIAVLQQASDFETAPLRRRLLWLEESARELQEQDNSEAQELAGQLRDARDKIYLYSARAENEQKWHFKLNSFMASYLVILLAVISIKAEAIAGPMEAGFIILISISIFLYSIFRFLSRARRALQPVRRQLDRVEQTIMAMQSEP